METNSSNASCLLRMHAIYLGESCIMFCYSVAEFKLSVSFSASSWEKHSVDLLSGMALYLPCVDSNLPSRNRGMARSVSSLDYYLGDEKSGSVLPVYALT